MRSTRPVAAIAGVLVLSLACRNEPAERSKPIEPKVVAPAASPPEAAAVAPPAKDTGPLTWIHDDFAAAEAKAKAAGLPIFIDLWAAWCHTCISMQETVLRDPAMAPLADRFVWLALDTENAANASVVARFPPEAWPTFYVVSPVAGTIDARHVGAASLPQLREMLTEGERGHLETMAKGDALTPGDPLLDVREGDRAAAKGDGKAAAAAFSAALVNAPADWPRAPDVMVRMASALARADDKLGCALMWKRHARARLGATASAADFVSTVADCLDALPPSQRMPARRALMGTIESVLATKDAPLSADDRGDALRILRELAEANDDKAAATRFAETQRAVLDRAAAEASSPWMASTYNGQRADVYVYLGKGEEILPALTKSAADLPKEYDPPYRQAVVLLALGRFDEGIAAAEKALTLATGPRRGVVLRRIAELQHGKGDHAAELATKRRAVEMYEALPPSPSRTSGLKSAKAMLERHAAEHPAKQP